MSTQQTQELPQNPSEKRSWASKYLESWYHWFATGVLKCGPLPSHIAFIMDGNRRFARKINKDTKTGHIMGEHKLQETLQWCLDIGIKTVTVFAWSTENFKRPKEEVDTLMKLAEKKCTELLKDENILNNTRIRIFGDTTLLPQELQNVIAKAVYITRNNTKAFFNVCFSYTSSDEITKAIKNITQAVECGSLQPCDITAYLFEQNLYSQGCTEPDVVVRTSGEIRLSDFLLWQSSYSCITFFDVLWPEFSSWHLYQTIIRYQQNYKQLLERREGYKKLAEDLQKKFDKAYVHSLHKQGNNANFEEKQSEFLTQREDRISGMITKKNQTELKILEDLSKHAE